MIPSSQPINWTLLACGVTAYERFGYKYIEVPWRVDEEALMATLPDWVDLEVTKHGNLVGSAEQSFLHMMINKQLKPGKYMAISPCFRNEREFNDLWQNHFMKLELIHILDKDFDSVLLHEMINCADCFLNGYSFVNLEREKTEEGFDLLLNGIEVGSYGYREYKDHKWIYGTGIAEPRFSYATRMRLG